MKQNNKIGIYKITSPNNKIYIGQSSNIENRIKGYKKDKTKYKKQIRLRNSFDKYGVENHIFEIIEECKFEDLNKRERYWQEYYDVLGKKGLNCRYIDTSLKKSVLSEITKNKIKLANVGKPKNHSKKGIQNIKDANSIPVIRIDKHLNIKEYPSAAEGARDIGIEKSGIISCTSNINKTSGGYAWVKKDEYNKNEDYSYKFNRKKHKMKQKEFFIPLNTPSSKNSKRWTGRMLISSKAVMDWKKESKKYWEENKDSFIESLKNKSKPYKIGFHFVRNSKRKYDWINPLQTIQDEMVKYGWLEDDNITEMLPFPYKIGGEYSTINKNNPGVFIKLF